MISSISLESLEKYIMEKVKIYISENPQEAELIKSLMAQSSITAEIRGGNLHNLMGEIPRRNHILQFGLINRW